MGGNPNLWSNMHDAAYVLGSSIPFNPIPQNSEPRPSTWSQLVFSGAPGEEKRLSFDHFEAKKLGRWEEQVLNPTLSRFHVDEGIIKQQGCLYGGHGGGGEEFQGTHSSSAGGSVVANWSHMAGPVSSSPRSSCVTRLTSSNNNYNTVWDSFSYKNADTRKNHLPAADHSSECSTATGGICKKARVQPTSSHPPLKVRKEKLGDRISALHQLVSPFGKVTTSFN
ncbi:transcription factor bHLH68 [Neltuma alba]|uniref:transcription factor bHLH68 n=1 Tax=Neltuma alba TaxID=207710 RepID=UPI0010A508B8|nr:transcription factor bHLH68-like [Prosopis alba]